MDRFTCALYYSFWIISFCSFADGLAEHHEENEQETTIHHIAWIEGNVMFNGSTVNNSGNSIIVDRIQLCQDIFYALEYIEQHVSIHQTP